MARAPALQAGSRRFDSDYLHKSDLRAAFFVEIVGVSRFAPFLPLLLMVPLGNQSSAEALRSRYAPNCPANFGCLFLWWRLQSAFTTYYILGTIPQLYLAPCTTHPVPYKLTLMPSFADISKGFSLRYEGSRVSENK